MTTTDNHERTTYALTTNGAQVLRVDQLQPNPWNPNVMTADEFAELVAEVRHLGRLPKPVVVRRSEDGYQIIDGEHGWRAAKDVGLSEIICEIIETDDFESMRQTYKRNQHGTHDVVRQGRMFDRMMKLANLSQRKLAKEMEVSEGTVRNSLEYVKAVELRNDYAVETGHVDKDAESTISHLSVKQVRLFNRLPMTLGNLWLSAGADVGALYSAVLSHVRARDVNALSTADTSDEMLASSAERLDRTGLLEFVGRPRTGPGFVECIKKVRDWESWERGWYVGNFEPETIRPYSQHYFRGVFYVRDESLMDQALQIIVDPRNEKILLTPNEFAACIEATEAESSSANDFQSRLTLAVIEKCGRLPDSKHNIMRRLQERELEGNAPEFIKASKLSLRDKLELLRLYQRINEETDEAEKPLLSKAIEYAARFPRIRNKDTERVSDAVYNFVNRIRRCLRNREQTRLRYALLTPHELAESIVRNFYEDKLDSSLAVSFKRKLSAFTKLELVALHNITEPFSVRRVLDRIFGAIDDPDEFGWIGSVMEGAEHDDES